MTAAELVERVRDALSDYGDVEETAAAVLIADMAPNVISCTVDDASVFDVGDWLHCEWEVMETTQVTGSPVNEISVRRGLRGSTATAHASGTLMRSNLRFSSVRILNALNAALAGAYPLLFKQVEDTHLTVVNGQDLYTLSSPTRSIRSFWIERTVGGGDYELCRLAVPLDLDSFILYGSWPDGAGIKVITTTTFTRMTSTGNLDSSFPDDDEAYDYLVKDAVGRLLAGLAASESINSSVEARGSQQGQDTRYVLINAAKHHRSEARESLRKCRMQLPVKVSPRPDARYF